MRLTGPANVLIMPAIHSASISTKLVQVAGRGDGGRAGAAGPVQVGADLPAVGLGLQDPEHGHHGRLRARPLAGHPGEYGRNGLAAQAGAVARLAALKPPGEHENSRSAGDADQAARRQKNRA